MATFEQRSNRPRPDDDEPVAAAPQARAQSIDDLLDEIDDVLESNAEEFVRSFVQRAASNHMSRRIFGLETEFGIVAVARHGRGLAAEEVARYMFRPVVEWGRSSNVFVENGSRLYLDVGSHPEYATAECDSVPQLIAYDRAGERIMSDLVAKAQAQISAESIADTLYCFKNNADSAGNSFGCHENYLVRRRADFSRLTRSLIPHLVSRGILTGAGAIRHTPEGSSYCFSARAEHLWEAVSSATTRSRPMINTRDEPHADAEKYRRLHVISGDSSMAEPTVLLKVGAMDLLLRMLEDGVIFTDTSVENPMRAIRALSRDFSARHTVALSDGRRVTGPELQQMILDQVRRYLASEGATDVDERVVDLWQRGIDAVTSADHRGVARELDWAIKYDLMQSYRERSGAAWEDPRLARMDLAYHDIAPSRGLYFKVVAAGLVDTVVAEADVQRAVEDPPATTRARLRGRFITAARAAKRDYAVDWLHLKLNEETLTLTLRDPFASSNDDVDRVIEQMAAS